MKLPGTNTITLTDAAIMQMLQEKLACDLSTGPAKVRVTAMKRAAYGNTIDFTVTTDAIPASPTTEETEP